MQINYCTAGKVNEGQGLGCFPALEREMLIPVRNLSEARGETPFLHVMGDNPSARRLCQQMGFRDYCETTLRVISAC
jgi:hypothetical protein